ncbi:GumC family protein [Pseudohalioglobus lutimaris]|uniref:Lipopolysaccharide biosynthesis protein n=1 Tax=Pseudohalioglobus lutimaris TaxID=1737061 RepID=A0A2N5WXT2_9GAMM|nr:hypothetical protein [Pseudohalioglobus lutimaris]PLW67051.1 hypothetical protein C0039_18715 [Pseudohalioglobus lutimaris]
MDTQFSKFNSLGDFLRAFRRRKIWFLLPAVLIFSIAVIFALVLPARFESQGVISIEEQAVSQDLVRSTVTSYAAQQVQVISQRVLAWENVEGLIKEYRLYKHKDGSDADVTPLEVREFRDNVAVELVSADVVDPRSGRPTQATIAFTVAFTDEDPVQARDVATELVELFLQEDQQDRSEQAASTEQFLSSEANRLKDELVELEKRISRFKEENEGSMPGRDSFNLTTLQSAQKEFSDLDNRIQALSKRRIEIAGKMSQINPTAPTMLASGDLVMSATDRLKALQTEYRKKEAVYLENHPDLIRLKREIAGLQAETGLGSDVNDLQRQLQEQEQVVAGLESRYRDDHHELIHARRVLEQIRESARKAEKESWGTATPVADNPAYVLLQTQLETINSDLLSMRNRQKELEQKINLYEELLKRAPEVEREYQSMLRDHKTANAEFADIRAKRRDALLAKSLEQEQKGERFELIQSPLLPSSPVSPHRPAIVFLGFILGVGIGAGLSILREITDSTVHGLNQLAELIGEAPLVAIPYISNDIEKSQQRQKAVVLIGGVILLVVAMYFTISSLVKV